MSQRKKVNSPRVNLVISLVFHTVAIGAIFFFAGREGMLGKRVKELTVSIAPKQKKPEPEKPKPNEPKVEPPKAVAAKPATAPPPVQSAAAPPPPSEAPPAAAPPSVELPSMVFYDGAKDVQTTSDPNELYKGVIERALRARWSRPEDIRDENYVADIELTLDKSGAVTRWQWVKGSGDKRWDDSVKSALAQVKTINRPPPKSFPEKFTVRFDVEAEATSKPLHLSSQ
jgi:outer membrane biosynthesis protein TonB